MYKSFEYFENIIETNYKVITYFNIKFHLTKLNSFN